MPRSNSSRLAFMRLSRPGLMGPVASLALLAGTPCALAQNEGDGPVSSGLQALDSGPSGGSSIPTKVAPAGQATTPGQGILAKPTGTNEASQPTAAGDDVVVDLHVNDEDLARVLEMLSIQSQRNIVASKNVSARITANLYGVTFYEAMEAILHVNGYGYIERGNFIYVYTLEEIAEIEKTMRQRISKLLKLNFLNAIDAAEFVKPLLSEQGQIKTNGKTETFAVGNLPGGADEFANDASIVVFDFEENVAEIEKLIAQLDTKPAQVLVEATILQTTLNEANAFGVDFSIIGDLDFLDFVGTGGPLRTTDSLIRGQGGRLTGGSSVPVAVPGDLRGGSVTSTPGNTAGPATAKVGIYYDDVAVFLRLLDEVTDSTILSNPKILALNRQPSRVLVGRKVGYLNTTSTDTSTTQSVQFLDTGTQLYFRPFVSSDRTIRMELKPQVSEAVIRDTRDATGAVVTIPDEITNELVTNVIVQDGQTVVLGGLFRESTESTRRQVPLLGDIPLIGAAFRGHEDKVARTEIIFLITPSIVNDQVMAEQGQRGLDYVERVRAGSREGLLPFSRDKVTGQMLVDARRLAAEGKTDEALHKVRRLLKMNPMQPEAIALRDELTNKPAQWPSRSMLRDIIRTEAENRERVRGNRRADAQDDAGAFGATASTGSVGRFNQAGEFEQVDPANEAPATYTQALEPATGTPTTGTQASVNDAVAPTNEETDTQVAPGTNGTSTTHSSATQATNEGVTTQSTPATSSDLLPPVELPPVKRAASGNLKSGEFLPPASAPFQSSSFSVSTVTPLPTDSASVFSPYYDPVWGGVLPLSKPRSDSAFSTVQDIPAGER
ncbi:MAG: hypothetical protein SFZ23_13090 [Planctomycetota bacterium]|nr:hypothetical protein [Planctomycetota bacterium]